jgi:hypothetical protein
MRRPVAGLDAEQGECLDVERGECLDADRRAI